MINANFEYTTNLQYRIKNLTDRVRAFESGEKYLVMKSEFERRLSAKNREVKKLGIEIADVRSQGITMRKHWMQVVEDMDTAYTKELQKKERKITTLQEELLETKKILAAEKDKFREKSRELYDVKTELEEEKGKNHKLRAQINRDYENSSIPSSMKVKHKKISNSREKTGRKPGGQRGHKGHVRKKQTPTNSVQIPAPKAYANNPDYKPTGKVITKQIVNLHISLDVDEYSTPEFRNIHTGQRVHAKFPPGLINDVNYGGSIKAFAFLLNNHCFVSIDKVREFLSELTDGNLQISKGMINRLSKEFSGKTEAEQRTMFSDILLSPVMNTDFTGARLNGKNVQVLVCATPEKVLYFAKNHKGHEGVKGTPVEDYQGTMVHDHDKTFYNYGNRHQECLVHDLRYLKDSMDNESDLKWNEQMRDLMRDMIHHRNGLEPGVNVEPKKTEEYENRYREILILAEKEYEYEPPSKYYRDGYNLYRRLDEYKDSHLLFLYDRNVPTDNNLSERLLRVFKRKQKQVMTFRSFDNIDYLCNSMGLIESFRSHGKNLYGSISSIFD